MSMSPKNTKEYKKEMEGELNEFFDPFFRVFGFESIKEKGFPVMDVFETSDCLYIEAELPGVCRERVRISIESGDLVIEGEKEEDRDEGENVKYICIERSFGKFRRTMEIPAVADASRIKAKYRDGILIISIPKVKEQRRKSRHIEVE